MPELPEVETMRRGALAVVGGRIVDVARPPCPRRPIAIQPRIDRLRARMVGRRINDVERAGKRVVLRLDNDDRLVIEPRMTGLVLLADPPTVEHLRLRIDVRGAAASRLWFWDRRGLGTVSLFTAAEAAARLGRERLGVDALRITADGLRQELAASRRAIKVALLDQRRVAGIGNLYASELLHVARIDPRLGCDELSARRWRSLHAAMLEVLEEAIHYEGSTLSDGTYRNALNEAGGYQNHHRVYDREGAPCPRCRRAKVARIVQAQRSTFFCPRCQR